MTKLNINNIVDQTTNLADSSIVASATARSDDEIIELHRCAFLDKIARAGFSPESYQMIAAASEEMIRLHREQESRDDGLPYCSHPFEVAAACVELFEIDDPSVVIAALFHDSLEDQVDKIIEGIPTQGLSQDEKIDLARLELAQKWGHEVSDIVTLLTNPNYTAAALLLQEGGDLRALQDIKHELYYKHVIGLIEFPSAFAVKMADYQSNALQVFSLPESVQKQKLISKYTPVIVTLLTQLDRGDLAGSKLVEQVVAAMRPGFERYLRCI